MTRKNIQIDGGLHRQVKMVATMHNMTIQDWTETVLRNAIAAEGMALVDPGITYTTEGENNA